MIWVCSQVQCFVKGDLRVFIFFPGCIIFLNVFCFSFIVVEDESHTWFGSDRDYTYDELLKRVFEIMHDKNPEMVAGKKQKFVMRPPYVVRIGTKKTSFANFADICKT